MAGGMGRFKGMAERFKQAIKASDTSQDYLPFRTRELIRPASTFAGRTEPETQVYYSAHHVPGTQDNWQIRFHEWNKALSEWQTRDYHVLTPSKDSAISGLMQFEKYSSSVLKNPALLLEQEEKSFDIQHYSKAAAAMKAKDPERLMHWERYPLQKHDGQKTAPSGRSTTRMTK